MRVLSAALAFLLVGVLAIWLWLDSSAAAREHSAGVMVSEEVLAAGAVQPGQFTPEQLAADGNDRLGDRSDELTAEVAKVAAGERALGAFAENVRQSMDQLAVDGDAASQDRKDKAAAEKKAAEKKAADKKAAEEEAARKAREAARPAPAPAPVVPPGMCWDDDEWEECDDDDWDDDWDDDSDDDDWDDD